MHKRLISIADYLDGIGLYSYANAIDKIIKKIAFSDVYGWWIDPSGKEHEVEWFGHAKFVKQNIKLFSSELTVADVNDKTNDDLCKMAFAKGWVRAINQGPSVMFEVPGGESKYLKACQNFIIKMPGVRFVTYDVLSADEYVSDIPTRHFLSAESIPWLMELSAIVSTASATNNAKLIAPDSKTEKIKLANNTYGWWISPSGQKYEVEEFGHETFIRQNYNLFSNVPFSFSQDDLYSIAFDKGWVRAISLGNEIVFHVPNSDSKYLKLAQGFVKDLPHVALVSYQRDNSTHIIDGIPKKHFMATDSVSWLIELMSYLVR